MPAALAVGRDAIALAYLAVMRTGLPILVILLIGAWLKKLLKEEKKPKTARHCWDDMKTPDAAQARAIAAERPDLPCWLAIQVSGVRLKEMCYSCSILASPGRALAKA